MSTELIILGGSGGGPETDPIAGPVADEALALAQSLESGDAYGAGDPTDVLLRGDPTPEWGPGGGGGGVSGIEADPVNAGPGALAMFPGAETSVQFTLYDPNLDAEGNQTGPNACYVYAFARDGSASLSATTWATQASATLRCTSLSGDDTGAFVSTLSLSKDTAAPATSEAVAVLTGSNDTGAVARARVLYDGRVGWTFSGVGGNVSVIGSVAVPDNADGDDGDWALGADGHLYFKTAGAWVEKV